MPETYGLPEEEPTRLERVAALIAGRHVVRTVILYAIQAGSLVGLTWLVGAHPLALLFAFSGVVALIMLMGTDTDLG